MTVKKDLPSIPHIDPYTSPRKRREQWLAHIAGRSRFRSIRPELFAHMEEALACGLPLQDLAPIITPEILDVTVAAQVAHSKVGHEPYFDMADPVDNAAYWAWRFSQATTQEDRVAALRGNLKDWRKGLAEWEKELQAEVLAAQEETPKELFPARALLGKALEVTVGHTKAPKEDRFLAAWKVCKPYVNAACAAYLIIAVIRAIF